MKIRPKPRKYNREDMDESYFAANSQEDGDRSREELVSPGESDFFKASKREFKIFEKKISEKNFASNRICTSKYTWANFVALNLTFQF